VGGKAINGAPKQALKVAWGSLTPSSVPATFAMNLLVHLAGNRPRPKEVDYKPVESIRTVSWNLISTYSSYTMLDSALPDPVATRFEQKRFDLRVLENIGASLVLAVCVLHKSFDPVVLYD